MKQSAPVPQTVFAPAKINLFLHIVGKKQDGYHLLQSLITFANFGDKIEITPADKFSFSTTGKTEHLSSNEDNLVVRAARSLAKELNIPLKLSIHLSKETPIGAGLGGGSADAAATIKGLLAYWNKEPSSQVIENILLELGADVPVCYQGGNCFVEKVGEIITPLSSLPKLPAVLVYPNEFCSTADIFENYNQPYSSPINLPDNFSNQNEFYDFLKQQKNDLTDSACQKIPAIKNILSALQEQEGCAIARMSGSGSACFSLFETTEQSKEAAKIIQKEKPDWWVWPVLLG